MSTILTTLPLGTARCSLVAALLLTLAIAGCGGGGGDDSGQPAVPAGQVPSETVNPDSDQTITDPTPSVDEEAVTAIPDDGTSATGGQPAASESSTGGGGPAMPGGGAEEPTTPVGAGGGVTDSTSPIADTVPQQPTNIDEDALTAGEVVVGEPNDVDQLFGEDDGQGVSIDDGEITAVVDDATSAAGEELVTDSDDLPLVADQSQSDVADGPATDDVLVAEQQPATEAIGDLFGSGGEVVSTQAATQSPIAPRELRWTLPSKRMDGSALGRQEVQAIELWGGLAHQPLRRWATLPPTAQYYGLAQVPQGVYRFAMVTIDRDGLRSDMSTAVIRDLR